MMKFLLIGLMLLTAVFASNTYEVSSVKGKMITVNDAQNKEDLFVGSTAVIVRKIGAKYETIVSKAVVKSIGTKDVTLLLKKYDGLEQDALPMLKTKVRVGDEVHLNWMHERVLIIAPTLTSYTHYKIKFQDKTIINSDLFASFLSKNGHPSPLKSDFTAFCKEYDIGLIMFETSNTNYWVDCDNFANLHLEKVKQTGNDVQVPFYSRIRSIDANWWGEGHDVVKNYTKYYTKLIGVK